MKNVARIKEIFEMYDYQLLTEEDDYLIYSMSRNLYPGIEIVTHLDGDSAEIMNLKASFQSQNYSVRICSSKDIDSIEDYLFNWFFQVKENNRRIQYQYKEYTDAVMRAYGISTDKLRNCSYRYVTCNYSIQRGFDKPENSSSIPIVQSLRSELDSEGVKLIIVEAPAGYGKTSTAMELLNSYSEVVHSVRPFYMELAQDRQAPTFYYLLVSQINKSFNVLLGDKIVMHHIREGRIPVIIDGFDELLSEDLDKGDSPSSRKKGMTMLSTIADLLKGNAKIVLTTRKTAILSGQDFYDWYYKNIPSNESTKIIRYILESPQIEDWLGREKCLKLSPQIRDLSNPVLLGYLSFLRFKDFEKECSSDTLVDNYIDRLLTREIKRQQLPFSKSDQMMIFEKLAAAFAYEKITAESRNNVKNIILLFSESLIEKYATQAKDSISLANTLTNHALLDRKGDNNIGFINDFVLGIFLGYAMIEDQIDSLKSYYKDMTRNFIEKVVISISACNKRMREDVWFKLSENCNLSSELRFLSDIMLLRQIESDYADSYLDGYSVTGMKVGSHSSHFNHCHFVNIVFSKSVLDYNYILECTFINCTFNEVEIIGDTNSCFFYDCKKDGNLFTPNRDDVVIDKIDEEDIEEDTNRIVDVLLKYLPKGGLGRKMQQISRLAQEFNNSKEFKKTFNQLCSKGYILTDGNLSHISDLGLAYLNECRVNIYGSSKK